ncbi:MAG TPA: hypothetical protein DCX07_06710 [Phycisphaerales bacterium]|nr:hypothetical protein [Phycisphaerales bacterium]
MEESTSTDTGSHLYEALAARIRKSICQGAYQPGELIGSEYELAREESVSRMTVRRACTLLVHEGLVERRPGKGLYATGGRGHGVPIATRMIQIVAGNLRWESSLQMSRGVQAIAKRERIQVQLYDAHGDMELDMAMLRQLPSGQAKGAVIVSLQTPPFCEAVYRLKTTGFPFVLADQRLRDIEVPSITADNYAGGYAAGRALLEKGHKRIAFVGDLVAATVQDRLAGLRDAMADAGLPMPRSLIADVLAGKDRLGDWSASVEECTRDLLQRPSPPTAIFFSCDAVARSAYRTLGAMGLSIPQDVSVIGFDDDPLAEWLPPPLTTVRQPFFAMGQAAMELLCKRMNDSNTPVEHRVMPVKLVERGSVAPPGASA